MTWDVFTYDVEIAGGRRDVVSPIDGRWLFEHGYGLAETAIFGVLLRRIADGGQVSPENFRPNRSFVDFLHGVIDAETPKAKSARLQAKRQREGYLYVIDGRTPEPEGSVPPEDIIGAFTIRNGTLVPGSYQRNDGHLLLTSNGFFALSTELETALKHQMHADCARQAPPKPPKVEPDSR